MAHAYGELIALTCDAQGQPVRFTWRSREYVIREVLATWHLRDRWWLRGLASASLAPAQRASDRTYYRVHCVGDVFGEVYHDAVSGAWILDRVYD
jgi:hypothetical protein